MVNINNIAHDGEIEGSETIVSVKTSGGSTSDGEDGMGTMVVNSEVGTLIESGMGTMVINSDDNDSTMKRK